MSQQKISRVGVKQNFGSFKKVSLNANDSQVIPTKTKILSAPYQQSFLQSDTRTAEQFLKDCEYNVNLENLYKIEKTCAYNQNMKYIPIQLEILPHLKKYYNQMSYLLQVWDYKGNKVYELRLNYRIQRWGVSNNILVYKTEADDENSCYFSILDLEKTSYQEQQGLVHACILLEDFLDDPSYDKIAFCNDKLYLADSHNIKIIDVKISELEKGEVQIQNVSPLHDVQTCTLKKNIIHQFSLTTQDVEQDHVTVAIENMKDHIILQCSLKTFKSASNSRAEETNYRSNYTFELIDQRQYVPDAVADQSDHITKFQQVITGKEELQFGVALRQSGRIDIYYDKKLRERVNQFPGRNSISNVMMSFDTLYLVYKKDDKVDEIDLRKRNRAIYKNRTSMKQFKPKYVLFELIKNNFKIISGYILIETTLFVSHGHMVSLFEIQTQNFKMVKHLSFDQEVKSIFRKYNPHQKTNDIGIILANDNIFSICSKTPKNYDSWLPDENSYIDPPGGEFIMLARDYTYFKFPLFMTKDFNTDTTYISSYYENYSIDITSQFSDLKPSDRLIGLYEDFDQPHYCLYQNDSLTLFCLDFNCSQMTLTVVVKFKIKIPPEAQNQDVYSGFVDHTYLNILSSKHLFKFDFKNPTDNQCIVIHNIKWRGFVVSRDHKYIFSLNNSHMEKNQTSGFKFYLKSSISDVVDSSKYVDKSYHLQNTQVGCQGFIDYSFTSERYVFLADFHTIKVIPTIKNNTINLMGQDQYSNYIATRQIKDRFHALQSNNIMSTWDILTGKKACPDVNIANIQVQHKMKEYMTYDESMDHGVDESALSGQTPNVSVLKANRKSNPKAYDSGDNLSESHLSKEKDIHLDLSDYVTFTCDEQPDFQKEGLYKYTLLMSKTNKQGYSENDFFTTQETSEQMEKHKPWIIGTKKVYRKFKLIEIQSANKIQVHLEFVFPYYLGKMQKMYFSDDYMFMLEQKLQNITTIYKRIQDPSKNVCEWEFYHQFSDFPQRIGLKKFMDVLSPDFRYFVDIDLSINGFRIKSTSNEKVVHTIPEYLMSYKGQVKMPDGNLEPKTPRWVFNRFKWMTSKSFRIISDDGIESMIDFSSGEFKQTAYRKLQNFDLRMSQTQHAFYSRTPLDSDQTEKRLAFKCRQYRSYQLFESKMKENLDMDPYESLFTIDFFQSNRNQRFIVDLSFSYLHWRLIEKINAGEVDLDEIDDEITKNICFNILPGGSSFLDELLGKTAILEKFYQRSIEDYDPSKELSSHKLKYQIPMFSDVNGKSAFDHLVDKNNFIELNMHLRYLSLFTLDHHSRLIAHLLPTLIKAELSNMPAYINSRQHDTLNLQQFQKGNIPDKFDGYVKGCKILEKPERIKTVFIDNENNREIFMKYIDIPFVHCLQKKLCFEYFSALGTTSQMDLFNQKPIQRQIDFMWASVQSHIIVRNLIPYLFYILFETLYQNTYSDYQFSAQEEVSSLNRVISNILKVLLIIQSSYYLFKELRIIKNGGLESYLRNIWNVFDISIPVLIIWDVLYHQVHPVTVDTPSEEANNFHVMQSIIILAQRWKIMYFMRIFPSIGFYVSAIFDILYALRQFLFVLLVSFSAFGEAYRRLNMVNEEHFFDIDSPLGAILFAYKQAKGGYSLMDGYGTIGLRYTRIVWLLATLVNSTVMFTFLISVVYEANGKITEDRKQTSQREKAALIADNLQILPKQMVENHIQPDEFLLYCEYVPTKH